MRKLWLKVGAGVILTGAGLYGLHRWQVKKHGPLGFLAKPSRFLKYAIALEAQQVPLYKQLADKAESNNQPHFATGLRKAMDVEQQHLDNLSLHAQRLGISDQPWTTLGRGMGLLSGFILSLFDISVGLTTVATIETKAADDYREAYAKLSDEKLKKLYLENQVDEETHYTWAREMLEQMQLNVQE